MAKKKSQPNQSKAAAKAQGHKGKRSAAAKKAAATRKRKSK